jgi:hypothetical protein
MAAICEVFLFQHFHSQSSNVWTAVWKGFGGDLTSFEKDPALRRLRARRH